MDPDEALKNAREALSKLVEELPFENDRTWAELAGGELADAFEALDAWLSKGGFLPKAWAR